MCRGCLIMSKGESTTYEYLDWYTDYTEILAKLKELNKKILAYEGIIDNGEQRDCVDKFRRNLIRLKKELGKSDEILNGVYKEGDK